MRSALGATLAELGPRLRRRYFLSIAAGLLTSLLDLCGVIAIGALVGLGSASLATKQGTVVLGIPFPAVTPTLIAGFGVFALAFFILKACLAITFSYAQSRFLARLDSAKAVRIVKHLLGDGLDRVHSYPPDAWQWASLNSTISAFSGLLLGFSTLVSEGSLIVLLGVLFLVVDPVVTAFTLVYFGLLMLLMHELLGKKSKLAGRQVTRGSRVSTSVLLDVISAFREVSITGTAGHFIDRYEQARTQVARGQAQIRFLSGLPRYIVETAMMLGVVAFVGWQFVSGQLGSGAAEIGIFLAGGVRLMGSVLPFQNALGSMKSTGVQAELALKMLAESRDAQRAETLKRDPQHADPQHESRQRGSAAAAGPVHVAVAEATFTYPGAVGPALDAVSLEVEAGAYLAVIGPSGAGKTTLMDALLGLLTPASGTVLLNGRPPRELERMRPGAVAYVPQRPGVVTGTLAENIALGIGHADIDFDRVQEVIELAALGAFVAALPHGINTPLGAHLEALSGGQIQRLGLARALYRRPGLIVLDEATSALDAAAEAEVSASIGRLAQTVTLIVVAHRLSTVQHADRVVVLTDGRVTASGTFPYLRRTVPMVQQYVSLMSFDAEEEMA